MVGAMLWKLTRLSLFVATALSFGGPAIAQPDPAAETTDPATSDETVSEAPEKVDVEPVAADEQISDRLERILEATEWFRGASVEVDEGVVFLSGTTETDDRKAWAGKLAGKTESVVAVVNRIRVSEPDWLDFQPAMVRLRSLARSALQAVPTTAVAIGLLILAWYTSKLASYVARRLGEKRVSNSLLRGVLTKAAALPVLLLGIYLALQVSGLTRLAATVLGGTGLLGIVLGIAFRDIAENFLASLLISIQRPFRAGDLITIEDHHGFVQAVTTRGTQLMTLDGNHVQIPNSVVYKSIVENASANPNVRQSFVVGIDYEDSAAEAQAAILETLRDHKAVLEDPEPLVLVNELATSTVDLQAFFWVDGSKTSVLKAYSAILRLVKRRLQTDGFSLPDSARELIFPQGVPVELDPSAEATSEAPAPSDSTQSSRSKADATTRESAEENTEAEGSLESDQAVIERQAAKSRPLDAGENLLESDHNTDG